MVVVLAVAGRQLTEHAFGVGGEHFVDRGGALGGGQIDAALPFRP